MNLLKIQERFRAAGEFPGSLPPGFRAALWLGAAFTAAFLIYPAGALYPGDAPHILPLIEHFHSQAKPLLYSLPLHNTAMPLAGVLSLLSGNADWAGAQLLWWALSFFICLSGYAFGCLLAGRAAGVAAAAALFAGRSYSTVFFDLEQRFYCLFLLIAANALAMAWLSPRARRLTESCAVGLSFLARSALCWFPLVLAALELMPSEGRALRRRLLPAALALSLPFLFLLPWTRLNFSAYDKLVLFDGRGDWNVVTGAMGLTSTFEGDYRKLAGIERGENAVLWSARRIASRPGAYASGVARRTCMISSKHPFIFACWLFFAALLWRRPGFRRVNLLIFYFLALHLAFSTEERYFVAILPLMAATAAASAFALGAGSAPEKPEGAWLSAAGAMPVFLAGIFCMFLLLRHPGRLAGDGRAAFGRALERRPDDAWLLREYGRLQLSRGDYDGAYRSLGRAVTLSPDDVPGKIDLAAAAFIRNRRSGRPSGGADLIEKLPLASEDWITYYPGKDYMLRALYELDAGLVEKAAESISLARQARREFINFKFKADTTEAGEERVRGEDTYVTDAVLPELLDLLPEDMRQKLGPAFTELYFGEATPAAKKVSYGRTAASTRSAATGSARGGGLSKKLSDEAVELIKKGDLPGAGSLLAEAVKADGDNFEARMDLCFLATKTGDLRLGEENCGEAVFLALKPPKHSVISKDRLPAALYSRADFYFKIGDKAKACLDLRRASEASPPARSGGRKAFLESCPR